MRRILRFLRGNRRLWKRRLNGFFCPDFNGWADGTLSRCMIPPPYETIARHATDDGDY